MYVDGNGSQSQRTLAHTLLQSPPSNVKASGLQLSKVAGGIGGLPPEPEAPPVPALPVTSALPPMPASPAPTPADPPLSHPGPSSKGAINAATRTGYQYKAGLIILAALLIRLYSSRLRAEGAR
jgi:hypothetical protein